MKKFEVLITERTAAIYPSYDGVHQSKVVDCSGEVIYSKKTVKEVLEESCIVHGSDYKGRIRAVRRVLSYDRKTPLLVSLMDYILAIPTQSPDNDDCIWLFCRHVHSTTVACGKTFVHFTNGLKMEVNCSYDVLHRQLQRGAVTMNYFSRYPRPHGAKN